jgi:transcriptional regulator with PAS, ATPase and Fis domain
MGSFDENVPKEYINHHANSYYFAIIINCGMTGNVKLGLKVIEIFNNKFKDSDEFYKIENHEDTLNIISGNFDESNYKANSFKLHAKICHSLSIGDLDSAGFFIEKLINMEWVGFYQPYLIDGFVLNLELSKRNTGKVRLALSEKKELGKILYLDDLYLGRLQLLEKNYFEADGTFRRLMANVVKYGAMNRLLFELQFAKEMKLSDILRLIDGWKSDSNQKTTSNFESHQKVNPNILNGVRLLIGKSKMMQQIKNQIKKYAGLKDIVLITGETGTGKELVAKALHEEGPHSKEPFLAINCGSLTDTLLQSELFGYEAGAFTGAQKEKKGIFESVGKGTVFLDEFGDISPKLQVSLLRVLESNEILMLGGTRTRTIECKIVVASNIDFRSAVESKKFREDLYFRLAKFEIKLPALRLRKEDLPELIQYFLDKNKINNGKSKIISTDLLEAFSNYNWPGNIRELKNEIDRLNILNPESEILGIKQFDFSRFQNQSTVNNEFSIKERLDLNPNQNIQNDTISKIIQNGFPMENRHAMLKELFVKYKKLTRKQVVEILKIATTTATKDLQTLCDQGFIVRKTPTKSSRTDYFEVN